MKARFRGIARNSRGIPVEFGPGTLSRRPTSATHPFTHSFGEDSACVSQKWKTHRTRSALYARELRNFVVVLCPRKFGFRSRSGPFVV